MDLAGRIVYWNARLERLLSRPAADVVGSPCCEVLGGVDLFGNRYCVESCPVRQLVRSGAAIAPFEVTVRRGSGEPLRLHVTIDVVPATEAERALVLHTFHSAPEAGPPQDSPLSRREAEILALVASGHTNAAIAGQLGRSAFTVRNHVQKILRKLGVHSRSEAVSFAYKNRFL